MERIYLDHNATSPLRPEAAAALLEEHALPAANPSSQHREGRAARARLEQARRRVADWLGAAPSEIVFTSGGSEAASAAIRGVCDRAPESRRRTVSSGVEHPAVSRELARAASCGFVHDTVACDREGRVSPEAFRRAVAADDVALACLQWANHETGVIQPVAEVAAVCRKAGVPLFVDAVQGAGKLPLDFRRAGVDLLAVSAHKLGGPRGAGALVVREGIALAPLIAGGTQEKRRRGGTEAVADLVALGAVAAALPTGQAREAERCLKLRARIETRVRRAFPEVVFHGQGASRLPNTVNFAIPGVPGEMLAVALDLAGVAVSTGAACSSGAVTPSPVLLAMGLPEERAREAVRISLGWTTTEACVDGFLERLPGVAEQVRAGLAPSS